MVVAVVSDSARHHNQNRAEIGRISRPLGESAGVDSRVRLEWPPGGIANDIAEDFNLGGRGGGVAPKECGRSVRGR